MTVSPEQPGSPELSPPQGLWQATRQLFPEGEPTDFEEVVRYVGGQPDHLLVFARRPPIDTPPGTYPGIEGIDMAKRDAEVNETWNGIRITEELPSESLPPVPGSYAARVPTDATYEHTIRLTPEGKVVAIGHDDTDKILGRAEGQDYIRVDDEDYADKYSQRILDLLKDATTEPLSRPRRLAKSVLRMLGLR